jgi:hypothetical protein
VHTLLSTTRHTHTKYSTRRTDIRHDKVLSRSNVHLISHLTIIKGIIL